jgi:hypothetical protein
MLELNFYLQNVSGINNSQFKPGRRKGTSQKMKTSQLRGHYSQGIFGVAAHFEENAVWVL